ncbi:MAG: ABC transporter permease [Deltaproteobacteria bacterium]|nr:ABC transporter permease [Deltaproteobacteria bacterium]
MVENGVVRGWLAALGRWGINPVMELGRMTVFFFKAFVLIFSFPLQIRKVLNQVHFIGAKSILVILLTGAFTGMVLGLQGYYSLSKFGSEGVLGSAVGLALVREMGPVLAAFMVIARAGSSLAAELASMRISEQIDALKTMEINPMRFLISPRLAGAIISFPLLTAIFDVVGIMGGYLTGSGLMGLASGVYFSSVESGVEMTDINGGFLKSVVFAALVMTICCFRGYYAHKSPAGFGSRAVALATTSSVVMSCVVILVADYILTSFLL